MYWVVHLWFVVVHVDHDVTHHVLICRYMYGFVHVQGIIYCMVSRVYVSLIDDDIIVKLSCVCPSNIMFGRGEVGILPRSFKMGVR